MGALHLSSGPSERANPPATELGGGIKRAVKKEMGRRRDAGKKLG